MLLHYEREPAFRPSASVGDTGGRCSRSVEKLVEVLYQLQEPWRARFLALISYLSTGLECNGHLPDREQVRVWLMEDSELRFHVKQLVEAWTRVDL